MADVLLVAATVVMMVAAPPALMFGLAIREQRQRSPGSGLVKG